MPLPVLLDKEKLTELSKLGILKKGSYSKRDAQLLDLAYQALLLGYIPANEQPRSIIQDFVITDIGDNYRFLFRHFGRSKAFYTLMRRLLLLKNPIKEIVAFLGNRDSNIVLNWQHTLEKETSDFEKTAHIPSLESVSVIIPTLNRYQYLKDVLSDLEQQTHRNFDVWICDQSDAYDPAFYERWNLNLHLIHQKEKALWLARNRCVECSKGEYLLFFDDDSRVHPDWIAEHLNCISFFHTKISAGVTETTGGRGISQRENFFHLSHMLDTGNVMIHRSVFDSTGLFDRNFERMRMGDGEFGLRCLLNGFKIIANPRAKRLHLKGAEGGLRQMGAWDAIHSIGLFKPKPIPSSLYLARKHFDQRTALSYAVNILPKSFIPYSRKKYPSRQNWPYYAIALILTPIILYSFRKSWKRSTRMLQ